MLRHAKKVLFKVLGALDMTKYFRQFLACFSKKNAKIVLVKSLYGNFLLKHAKKLLKIASSFLDSPLHMSSNTLSNYQKE